MILSNKPMTKGLVSLICADWSASFFVHKPPKTGFLMSRPIYIYIFECGHKYSDSFWAPNLFLTLEFYNIVPL